VVSLVAFPFDSETRMKAIAGRRRVIELAIGEKDLAALARMLLAYREDPSFLRWDGPWGVHHQTVQRRIERRRPAGRWRRS
jgi:hypothetical protein